MFEKYSLLFVVLMPIVKICSLSIGKIEISIILSK